MSEEGRSPVLPGYFRTSSSQRLLFAASTWAQRDQRARDLPCVAMTRFREQLNKVPLLSFVSPSLPSNSGQMKVSPEKQAMTFYFVAFKVGA